MKKTFHFVLAFVLVIPGLAQKEKLSLNLLKNENYLHKISSKASIVQTVNGQEMEIQVAIRGTTNYKITGIQDSIYELEVNYVRLSLKMNHPTGDMESSSDTSENDDIFSRILNLMTGKPFFARMTKTGKIREVKNFDTLVSKIFDQFPELTEIRKQQYQNQLMQSYGEKALTGNIEMITAIFPDNAVAKGEKWVIRTNLESGMSASLETTYELKEINDTYYFITGNANIKTADKDAYIESNGMPVKYDLEGTMNSDIKIDRRSGWIIEAKINQNISGNVEIKDNPQLPGGMILPMTIITMTTITK